MTILDAAHAAMASGGEAEALTFWRMLADAELFLVLDREAEGEVIEPRVFSLTEGDMLLAFDSEERLATISATPVPYVALPGRVVAAQLAGQGLSLGLNLGTGAASETILPEEAMDWLVQMLDQTEPEAREAALAGVSAPRLPEAVLSALAGLVPVGGVAAIAAAEYQGGGRGHVLALAGVETRDETRMARAVTEALAFSGLDAAALDLVFCAGDAGLLRRIAAAGLSFRGPEPVAQEAVTPSAPGSDPARPPRLR